MVVANTLASGHRKDSALQELKPQLRGQVICPDDPDDDPARRFSNGMLDRYPRVIARCHDVAAVITAVNVARENERTLAGRDGGHRGPGLRVVDDGLVLDLVRMQGICADPAARTARVEGGCTWGDVDHVERRVPGMLRRLSGSAEVMHTD